MKKPSWRNWIAHQTSNLGVAGSNPAGGAFLTIPAKIGAAETEGSQIKEPEKLITLEHSSN